MFVRVRLFKRDLSKTSMNELQRDDLNGGRVCFEGGCGTQEDDYELTVFSYSAYTAMKNGTPDSLIVAAFDQEENLLVLQFSPVPYRLYLKACDYEEPALNRLLRESQRRAGDKAFGCDKRVDEGRGYPETLVQIRLSTEDAYSRLFRELVQQKVRFFTDSCVDPLFNLGIPGARFVARCRKGSVRRLSATRWWVERPDLVCVHFEVSPTPNVPVLRLDVDPEGRLLVARGESAWTFELAEAAEFVRLAGRNEPKAIVV